jgi:hypothetical protein
MAECIRCGECCKNFPCVIASIRFRLKGTYKGCPALTYLGDGKYSCQLITEADGGWDEMLGVGNGCTFPQYRKMEAKI